MIKYVLNIILLLTCTQIASACDCANRLQIDSVVKNTPVIFSGKLISQSQVAVLMHDTTWILLDSPDLNEPFIMDYIKYTFAIEVRYKGAGKSKTFDVYTPAGSAACGYQFFKEQVYIIYGDSVVFSQYNGEKTFGVRTTTCDRTDKFNKQEEKDILQILKKVK